MGLWNDISGAFNKGVEGAGRFADATGLKFKLGECERKRRDLAADLGELLYDSISNGGEPPAACERVIMDIRTCDAEIAQIKADIERIVHETESAKAASVAYSCPSCGATLPAGARFCHACGAPAAYVPASARPAYAVDAPDGAGSETTLQGEEPAVHAGCGMPSSTPSVVQDARFSR
ncbi:MAG: zinc ribbon domain-containing protein [Slackia sp.]|nr:zinc ribbon domain-containing protein [Slackia sp.]